MTTSYKFIRTIFGTTAFAVIKLSSTPALQSRIIWPDSLQKIRQNYGTAIECGIHLALSAHDKAGGKPQEVLIRDVVTTTADTKPDAVKCAAALGLWKELGHTEDEVVVSYSFGLWEIKWLVT